MFSMQLSGISQVSVFLFVITSSFKPQISRMNIPASHGSSIYQRAVSPSHSPAPTALNSSLKVFSKGYWLLNLRLSKDQKMVTYETSLCFYFLGQWERTSFLPEDHCFITELHKVSASLGGRREWSHSAQRPHGTRQAGLRREEAPTRL